ncbi:ATP-binding protein [Sporolituus thermophilus]|uniref:Mg-protoporphyrin IX chelatase n=1 Tax=Sporolituus thermophilus DSM 23256 TaxID=1123285 RepID=A0A1G7IEP8_9FIRM|nr:ATP-binding protein [Sporolituus thermophilus]SDF11058.1 magnesium chelatase subunit I [Sporolituus thermophilus DSM 23256]
MQLYHQLVRHSGNQNLFQAVEMSIAALVNGHPFHIHVEGLRGTGKTTIMRAARELLPPIVRVKNCLYNCDPAAPHCPEHRGLSAEALAKLGTETVPRPFLEISHAAKIGTVVGSIDLPKLTNSASPLASFLPGTIPQAHRGIIFIDEINRLADTAPELVDVLLDVMGTKPGRIQLEETGLPSCEFSVNVTVWAASNPDEEPGALAQIRKQLADRFDIVVVMGRPGSYQDILSILNCRQQTKQSNVAVRKPLACGDLAGMSVPAKIRDLLAKIYIDFSLESLRAVEALETAATLAALSAGRRVVEIGDVSRVVPLVLGHRTDYSTITNILRYLETLEPPAPLAVGRSVTVPPVGETGQSQSEKTNRAAKKHISRLWSAFKKLFGAKQDQTTEPPVPPPSKNSSSGQETPGHTTAGRSPQIANPAETPVTAPPRPAAPLTSLAVEQYVTGEEKSSHG